jgi:hypothetical protein
MGLYKVPTQNSFSAITDYYNLLARALGQLQENTDDARRALYERAISALTNQLRAFDPPLNESDVVREQRDLAEAILKIEAEARESAHTDAVAPDRPSIVGSGRSASERLPDLYDGARHGHSLPARMQGRFIGVLLLVLTVAAGGAGYWQRYAFASLIAKAVNYLGIDIWSLAVPILAYGIVALIFLYLAVRAWFDVSS